MNNRQVESLKRVFGHRVTSMLEDGYSIVTMSDMTHYIFYKLHHHTNGNEVTFHVYPSADRMVQKSNGRVVYDGPIMG